MPETMKAAVALRPGPPEVLSVREVPRPEVRDGWTLVRVRAFGLNRSELMTRQGHSPNVRFPRVLGIECVGEVAESSDPALAPGQRVAAIMGEMGREFDGGYAEYALLPNELLIPVTTSLDWETFAALPETYLTALGSLGALGVDEEKGGLLLVRGGSSSVGMAALSLARDWGLETIATTRNPAKANGLREAGADHVVIDNGDLADPVWAVGAGWPTYILDLVGANTVVDSLRLATTGGTVCVTGMLSNIWVVPNFEPVAMIPSGTKLTTYHSADLTGRAAARALEDVAHAVDTGRYRANVDRVFRLDEIVAAHRYMENDRATGKIVVTT
ncbi:zinc-binding dehydrogenase [Pseudonocardia acaciae]|uniref:zinc-binding dehydrogenase n=1 Tax=Pseudonocardia acaciae TaxID=551276 RepID=UPI00055B9554|nr:zinc-binding dehydrogenase [Pseudonocardia acaciae]